MIERDYAGEIAQATVDIAEFNAEAATSEAAALGSDNVSCTVGQFGAVNQKAVEVPTVVFVNGRDVATGGSLCIDIDVLDPEEYGSKLVVTLEYLHPVTRVWVSFDSATCTKDAAHGVSLIPECTKLRSYDRFDPIQMSMITALTSRCSRTTRRSHVASAPSGPSHRRQSQSRQHAPCRARTSARAASKWDRASSTCTDRTLPMPSPSAMPPTRTRWRSTS